MFFDQLRKKRIAIVRHNLRICGNPPLGCLSASILIKVCSRLWMRDNTLADAAGDIIKLLTTCMTLEQKSG